MNRSSLYYKKVEIDVENLELMKLIDLRYLKTPFFGSRRMTKTLQHGGGSVNRKRVQRLMRLMGLEAIYHARASRRLDTKYTRIFCATLRLIVQIKPGARI